MSDSGDRVHPATPARQQQARRDGDLAKSQELVNSVQMLAAIVVAYLFVGSLGGWIKRMTENVWSYAGSANNLQSTDMTPQIQTLAFGLLVAIAPMLLLLLIAGIGSHWIQTGPVFVTKRVAPDLTRLSAKHWFAQLFSWRSLSFPILGLPKSLIAMAIMIASCWFHRQLFFDLGAMPVDQMVESLFQLVLKASIHVAFALLLMSMIDFALQYVGHHRRIRMSDQELRDENRMQNGDPQIAAHRREIQQALRR